jgi:hypothetical protein
MSHQLIDEHVRTSHENYMWMFSQSVLEITEIFSILRSRFAVPCIFPLAMPQLGDIGVHAEASPMDISASFEVYHEDLWWSIDARYNLLCYGRVLMATARDASDLAMITSFGMTNLTLFVVISKEQRQENTRHASDPDCAHPALSGNPVRADNESLWRGSYKIERITGYKCQDRVIRIVQHVHVIRPDHMR